MGLKTVLDCFCGVGGISIGADMAGLQVIGGVDRDPAAIECYSSLFGKEVGLCEDLLETSALKTLRRWGMQRGDVDILAGGPPCQPFSVYNHQRNTTDNRCWLVTRFLEFASILRPPWVMIENVPGFVSIDNGKFLELVIRSLRARGYSVGYRILDALSFGVPQRRRRLVLLGGRERASLSSALAAIANTKFPQVNVKDALGDLPEETGNPSFYCKPPQNVFQALMRNKKRDSIISAHISSQLGPLNLRRIAHVPVGGNWRDIPVKLLTSGMKRARQSDHTTRYGRLSFSAPAFTLLTKCDPHWGCFVHPLRDRVLSVREAARLQSIPDHVPFPGVLRSQYRLVGNAVPPLMARGILQELS